MQQNGHKMLKICFWTIFGPFWAKFFQFSIFFLLFKMKNNGQNNKKMRFWPVFGQLVLFKIKKWKQIMFLVICTKF